MNILSIDIGLTGGIVLSKDGIIVHKIKMPVRTITDKKGKSKRYVDIEKLYQILNTAPSFDTVDLLLYEDLHSLGMAGKQQTWSLAYQCGIIETIAIFMRYKYMPVQAKDWQELICKDIPPLRKKTGRIDTKARAYMAYKKLYPNDNELSSKDDGIIDAILINHYAIQKYS